jgi:hypothetical protein
MKPKQLIIDKRKLHKIHKNYQEHLKKHKLTIKYKRPNMKVKFIKHRINKNK